MGAFGGGRADGQGGQSFHDGVDLAIHGGLGLSLCGVVLCEACNDLLKAINGGLVSVVVGHGAKVAKGRLD